MNGPVAVSFAKFYPQAAGSFLPTLVNLGIPMNPEPMSGDNRGGYVTVLSIDQQLARRSDAATAYLLPNLFRKNLEVLTGAQATKVVFDQNKTATGVQFVSGGVTFTARARKEVIISAGTIQVCIHHQQNIYFILSTYIHDNRAHSYSSSLE
jgi:choline dehydrogenase-like flavoprotein